MAWNTSFLFDKSVPNQSQRYPITLTLSLFIIYYDYYIITDLNIHLIHSSMLWFDIVIILFFYFIIIIIIYSLLLLLNNKMNELIRHLIISTNRFNQYISLNPTVALDPSDWYCHRSINIQFSKIEICQVHYCNAAITQAVSGHLSRQYFQSNYDRNWKIWNKNFVEEIASYISVTLFSR